MKALAAEMTNYFSKRLEPLGITVKELTGDMQLTKGEIQRTQVHTRTHSRPLCSMCACMLSSTPEWTKCNFLGVLVNVDCSKIQNPAFAVATYVYNENIYDSSIHILCFVLVVQPPQM